MLNAAQLMQRYGGSILAVSASVCFTLMDATAQSCMSDGLGAGQVAFIRMLATTIVLLTYLHFRHPERLQQLDPRSRQASDETADSAAVADTLLHRRPAYAARLIWIRSTLATAGLCLGYASMSRIALSEFSTVYTTRTFFIGFLCWVVLKEAFGWRLRLAAVASSLAVLLVVQPPFLFGTPVSGDSFSRMLGFVLGFASVLAEVVEMVILRILGPGPDPLTMALGYSAASVICAPFFTLVAREEVQLSLALSVYLKLGLLAVLGLSAQMCLVMAMQVETGAMVGVMSYAQIPFALLVQSIIVSEFPNFVQILGMYVILVAGVWAVVAETSEREQFQVSGQMEEYALLSASEEARDVSAKALSDSD